MQAWKRLNTWPWAVVTLAVLLVAGPAVAREDGPGIATVPEVEVPQTEAESEASGVSRDIEETIWFQGFLADVDTGDPLSGDYNIQARLYSDDPGGVLLWGPEYHNATTLTEGWFNIELGAYVALPSFDTPPYYLDLVINSETLEPRQKLASVPTAFHSDTAQDSDGDWVVAGDVVYRLGADVGIGTRPAWEGISRFSVTTRRPARPQASTQVSVPPSIRRTPWQHSATPWVARTGVSFPQVTTGTA